MVQDDFGKMAEEREEFAQTLSDQDIWKSVIRSAIVIEGNPAFKANILLTTIPDIGMIFGQLRSNNKQGLISDQEYHDILEVCIKTLESRVGYVEFDPLKYDESSD
ncbi:MAG: hypothetical protein ACW98K_02655 [Candidatus Kariarchaeaceae archaeon]|jgi:hypothetical protein